MPTFPSCIFLCWQLLHPTSHHPQQWRPAFRFPIKMFNWFNIQDISFSLYLLIINQEAAAAMIVSFGPHVGQVLHPARTVVTRHSWHRSNRVTVVSTSCHHHRASIRYWAGLTKWKLKENVDVQMKPGRYAVMKISIVTWMTQKKLVVLLLMGSSVTLLINSFCFKLTWCHI